MLSWIGFVGGTWTVGVMKSYPFFSYLTAKLCWNSIIGAVIFVLFILSVICETTAFAFYVQGKETDDKIHILHNPIWCTFITDFYLRLVICNYSHHLERGEPTSMIWK